MAERQRITLVCSECHARNYPTTKARRSSSRGLDPGDPEGAAADALELKKFCKHCDKHTLHRESK